MSERKFKFDTLQVHAGQKADPTMGSRTLPIYQIKDMSSFSKINEVYASYFTEPYLVRSCVEVSRLPKDILLEIEAITIK